MLSRLEKWEVIFLYIAAFKEAEGTLLIVKKDGEQRSVYYMSKVLHSVEVRYQRIEKLAYVIVLAFRRLKHYFWAHSIFVKNNQPIHQVL